MDSKSLEETTESRKKRRERRRNDKALLYIGVLGLLLTAIGVWVGFMTWLSPYEPIGPSPFAGNESDQGPVQGLPTVEDFEKNPINEPDRTPSDGKVPPDKGTIAGGAAPSGAGEASPSWDKSLPEDTVIAENSGQVRIAEAWREDGAEVPMELLREFNDYPKHRVLEPKVLLDPSVVDYPSEDIPGLNAPEEQEIETETQAQKPGLAESNDTVKPVFIPADSWIAADASESETTVRDEPWTGLQESQPKVPARQFAGEVIVEIDGVKFKRKRRFDGSMPPTFYGALEMPQPLKALRSNPYYKGKSVSFEAEILANGPRSEWRYVRGVSEEKVVAALRRSLEQVVWFPAINSQGRNVDEVVRVTYLFE